MAFSIWTYYVVPIVLWFIYCALLFYCRYLLERREELFKESLYLQRNDEWKLDDERNTGDSKMIIWLDHLHYGILFSIVRILLLQRVLITDQHIFHENFFQANCYSGEMMSKYMYILSSEKCFFTVLKL